MNKFKDRLRYALSYRNMKQVELSEKTGLSKSLISHYLSGYYIGKQDKIFLIAKALDVDPSWLMGKDVLMNTDAYLKDKTEDYTLVPLLGKISAGTANEAINLNDGYVCIDKRLDADFALIVKGDSMIGARIYPGDIIYVKQQSYVENGQIAVVRVNHEDFTLKRVRTINDEVMLIAENPQYKPIIVNNEDAGIIGKVVKVEFEPK